MKNDELGLVAMCAGPPSERARDIWRCTTEDARDGWREVARAVIAANHQPSKPSDIMGRFAFDGAEGYAFHIYGAGDQEVLESTIKFDELSTLKVFLQYNLPGLFTEGGES